VTRTARLRLSVYRALSSVLRLCEETHMEAAGQSVSAAIRATRPAGRSAGTPATSRTSVFMACVYPMQPGGKWKHRSVDIRQVAGMIDLLIGHGVLGNALAISVKVQWRR
jgi:hypothetical protein